MKRIQNESKPIEEGIQVTPNTDTEVIVSMSSSNFSDEPLYDNDKQYSGLLEED